MLFPIIMLLLCGIGYLAFFIFNKKQLKKADDESVPKKTAQEFINVKEIKENSLFTNDCYVINYLQIQAISIELLSDREKENLANNLTAEISGINKRFKFLAVSRPVDIAPLIENFKLLISESKDPIQKELLRQEIMTLADYALSGDVVERQFFVQMYQKNTEGAERELRRSVDDLKRRFEVCNIHCNILDETGIIRLCNLINNPAYISVEEVV